MGVPTITEDKEKPMRVEERDRVVVDWFTGQNGQGSEPFEDQVDPEAMQRVMQSTLNRVALGGITDEDAQIITGISQHVEGGLFHQIARRRGGSWRLVAALADRVVQFEGLAKIHMAVAMQTQNMDIALALKSMSTLQRLEHILNVCGGESPAIRAIMAEGITRAQARVLAVWEKAPDDYLRDASRRMGGDYYG
jgi:hypothetical protein